MFEPREKTWACGLAAVSLVVALGAISSAPTAQAAPGPNLHAGSEEGVVHAKHAQTKSSAASLLSWHKGQVMTSADITSIFWGSSWNDATKTGDKISGLDGLYSGIGGTTFMNTNTEYTGSNGRVGAAVTYRGHATDLTGAGTSAPSTSAVLAVVARNITNPVANGYYPVYSDIPRGSAGYCAWHSYGTINNVPVQFGFFFRLDGDAGCDPGDTSGLHSQGLAAVANVSGHELSEAVTDPRNGGWYDRTGAENSDKCAWTFSGTLVTLANGSRWKIQGNFSNSAYTNHTGYNNGGGCIVTR